MTDKKCPKCKSPIVGEGKFCVKCGFDFSQDSSVSKTTETSEISKTTTLHKQKTSLYHLDVFSNTL